MPPPADGARPASFAPFPPAVAPAPFPLLLDAPPPTDPPPPAPEPDEVEEEELFDDVEEFPPREPTDEPPKSVFFAFTVHKTEKVPPDFFVISR